MVDHDTAALIPDQRRERLLELLRKDSVLSVQQLTELLQVSHMTIRRDIAALEREGRASSVPGGVRISNKVRTEPSFIAKSITELPEKHGMAVAATGMVEDGMTIYLDAGTTILSMVPHLTQLEQITVLTNDFTTASNIIGFENIELVHVGGLTDHRNRSTVGRLAAATLQQVNIDISFISASSWDIRRGVTTPSEPKVEVKQAAMAAATFSVLVSGTSKFGTFSMHRVASLDKFKSIITDRNLGESAVATIQSSDTNLILTDPIRPDSNSNQV